jgi:hypothetical protein
MVFIAASTLLCCRRGWRIHEDAADRAGRMGRHCSHSHTTSVPPTSPNLPLHRGRQAAGGHPGATNPKSATIRHGLLFVYSHTTPFQATEAGAPHGYNRFRAYAVLDHGGNLRAAARALQ